MQTEYQVVDRKEPADSVLAAAAERLRQGGLVAFPTETVYGLGANGLDPAAVAGIYRAKGRPSDNPLILHIAQPEQLSELVAAIPANARALMNKYWPGPLTLVLARKACVPDCVTGGLDTVAVRLPDSAIARRLIALAGVPVAAPSANTSGRPSPTTAAAVLDDLQGKIDMVLDGGDCSIGVESTVVDCTTPVPTLLRPGGITLEMLQETLGEVEIDPALGGLEGVVPRSPGMKYTHYAPQAPMVLVEGDCAGRRKVLCAQVTAALAAGRRVGALVSAETAALLPPSVVAEVYGAAEDAAALAATLYTRLRAFDGAGVEQIFAEGLAEEGLGLAVMNRLRKACGYHIIQA